MNRASNRSQELVQSGKTNVRLRSDTSRRASQVRRMEPYGAPWLQPVAIRSKIGPPSKPQKQAKSVATGCHRLPETFHGKQGVCRGLPPVAGGPLPAREEVDSQTLAPLSGGGTKRRESLPHDCAAPATRARACTLKFEMSSAL
jgi:hypothetical protein